MVSHAMENYVAAIWRLTQYGGVATTSEVARHLGVTAASTSYMFKKMAESGLVQHREYAGVTLTAEGEQAAMVYIRRHRVVERFLVDVLGIPWDRADDISDEMEHSLRDEVVDRMEVVMGFPGACPHGYPIPTKEGVLPPVRLRPLTDLTPDEEADVAQVAEHDPKLLTYFGLNGLRPGNRVRVLQRDSLGETMTLRVDGSEQPLVLAVAIAKHIRVQSP